VNGSLRTAREVAEYLGYSTETILRWTREHKLRGIRMPDGRLRYRDEDIEAWLAARETEGRTPGEDVRATHPLRPAESSVATASDPQKEDDHAP
jgi:excisionase family DNA binding protein